MSTSKSSLSSVLTKATIFVRHIPIDCDKQKFQEFFSKVGTVKNCIILPSKRQDAKYQIGFVYFSTSKEAQQALTTLSKTPFTDTQEPLLLELALKQSATKDTQLSWKQVMKSAKKASPEKPSSDIPIPTISKSMIISGIDQDKITRKHLFKRLKKYGDPQIIEYPYKDVNALVTFANISQSKKAFSHLDKHTMKGCLLSVQFNYELPTPIIETPNKLLIKNISFDIKTENELRSILRPFGKLYKVTLLPDKKHSNPHRGIAIVIYCKKSSSIAAIKALDGKEINNRKLQVSLKSSNQNDVSDSNENETKKVKSIPNSLNDSSIFVRHLPLDVTIQELQDLFSSFGPLRYVKLVNSPSGQSKGSAFVCFKSKNSYEKCLNTYKNDQDAFQAPPSLLDESKPLDSLKYTENTRWTIKGRLIQVMPAVNRDDISKIEKDKIRKDKRNLYLTKVGILSKSEMQEISQEDRKKRLRSQQERAIQLKELNNYVSMTRLSIRNLPANITESKLKSLCKEMVLSKRECNEVVIKQVKIIKLEREGKNGSILRPSGYAFVEFLDHEDAMACLLSMNNHPTLFKNDKRPIIEFAIENGKIMKQRQEREKTKNTIK